MCGVFFVARKSLSSVLRFLSWQAGQERCALVFLAWLENVRANGVREAGAARVFCAFYRGKKVARAGEGGRVMRAGERASRRAGERASDRGRVLRFHRGKKMCEQMGVRGRKRATARV